MEPERLARVLRRTERDAVVRPSRYLPAPDREQFGKRGLR